MSDETITSTAPKRQRKGGRRKPKIGEIGIRYGERNFFITPGQQLICQDGPWHLVVVPAWNRGDWVNFKLYYDEKASKNLFNIAALPTGVYVRRDMKILQEYHPGRDDWVKEQIGKYLRGETRTYPERGETIKYGKSGWRKTQKVEKR